MLGNLYTDTLTLGDGVVIHEQMIGVASKGGAPGLSRADGILGLGPILLTVDSLVDPDEDLFMPTVIDNLYTQGSISQRIISYFFVPTSETEVTYGRIMLGEITPDHTGSITYT